MPDDPQPDAGGSMTLMQAVFIGVGAMVGAGIFALLGEAGAVAKSAVWLSFVIAGGVAALQGYSFARLGAKYASEAGMMGYISAGFGGRSRVTSTSTWLVFSSSMIVVAMVAVAFGSYAAATIAGGRAPLPLVKIMATAVLLGMTALNAVGGAGAVAKAQSWIVRIVLAVLISISVVTMYTADWRLLAPSTYPSFGDVLGSVALTFFAFLGFGMISFTARDLKHKKDLGIATYVALAIATATYAAVALGVFGQLAPAQVTKAGPLAIALAAQPVLGRAGYWIVAVTAMLATAGAANAYIYPASGLLEWLANEGLFPPVFGLRWRGVSVGLLITAAIILMLVWAFDLTAIASLGSAVALLLFLLISVGHIRIRRQTGASLALLLIGVFMVAATLVGFVVTTVVDDPVSMWAFAVIAVLAVVLDIAWRAARDHNAGAQMDPEGQDQHRRIA